MKNKGTLTLSGTLAFICITTISGKKSKRNKKKKIILLSFFFFFLGGGCILLFSQIYKLRFLKSACMH